MTFYPRSKLAEFSADDYFSLTEELAQIDKSDIAKELTRHPSVYSYYHGLMIIQKTRVDKLSNETQHYYSLIRTQESTTKKSAGFKATAAYLEDFANSDDEYLQKKTCLLKEEEVYLLLKAICTMLEHKKDMLIQLSANLRSETKLYN